MGKRQWTKKNPARAAELQRYWVERNRERAREIWRNLATKKRADPTARMHGRISNQIYAVIKRGKNCRSAFELVGYTSVELNAHLERQFKRGMGWHNMGEWHIDHIIPLSSFVISGPDDPNLRRAWALSNLRPLWAVDNMRKGARMEVLL